jgi:pimeloyl-ACP methyl ester carboxylesterase
VPQTPALFIHGVGRAGRAAWPHQHALERDRPCLWLPRVAPGDPPARMLALAEALLDGPAHVVAHSYGALAALRLAQVRPELARSLTLVEPAALHLSRGAPHTEQHVAAMEPVFARARDRGMDDREFSRLFAEANGMPVPDVPADVLASLVAQLRATAPPWTLPVDASVAARTPVLVVAGAMDTMYGEVAETLRHQGAELVVLDGTGHRPHDDERFAPVMARFWAAVDS